MAAPKGHSYTIGNNGGRPPKFETEELLITAVNEYFVFIQGEKQEKDVPFEGKVIKQVEWDQPPEPATVTGLALFLGFDSRQSLYDYEKNEKFSYIIKRARLRIEHEYEKRLDSDKPPTGAIFALKNMGWKDQSEIKQTIIEKKEVFKIGDQEYEW